MSNIIMAASDHYLAAGGNLNGTIRGLGLWVFLPLCGIFALICGIAGKVKLAGGLAAAAIIGATMTLGPSTLWTSLANWGSGVATWVTTL